MLDFGTGHIYFGKGTNFKLPCDATAYPDPTNISISLNAAVVAAYDICVGFSCDDVSGNCKQIVLWLIRTIANILFMVPIYDHDDKNWLMLLMHNEGSDWSIHILNKNKNFARMPMVPLPVTHKIVRYRMQL